MPAALFSLYCLALTTSTALLRDGARLRDVCLAQQLARWLLTILGAAKIETAAALSEVNSARRVFRARTHIHTGNCEEEAVTLIQVLRGLCCR